VHDFGILKFDPKKIRHSTVTALKLDPDSPRVGLDIDVVGYPATRELKSVSGVISQMHSEPPSDVVGYCDFNTNCIRAAVAGAAQSPGSPMIDLNGNAIALKMSGTSNKDYNDDFLPLDRPLRALQYIQRGEKVPRGTIQVMWRSISFDTCRMKGLASTWLDSIQRTDPKRTTMLVTSIVLPEGPSDTKLQNGDILIKANGALIHQHILLEDIIDSNVGNSINLLIHRGSKDLEFNVQVGDLHGITPDRFVTVAGGTFHTLSYQQAQRWNIAARGVYLCDRVGGTFDFSGSRGGWIVEKMNNKFAPDLEAFIDIMASLRDRSRVMIGVRHITALNIRNCRVIQIDRHWHPKMTLSVRNDRTGCWDATAIKKPLPAIRPTLATASFMRMNWPNRIASNIARSIVTIECSMPLKLDGQTTTNETGVGLVIDAKCGLVVTSRATVPFDLCNISITIAENIVVDGRVLFLHPQHNYSIVQYDPALVGAPVQSAKLSTEVIRPGADVVFVGADSNGRLSLADTKVIGVAPFSSERNFNAPSYRSAHVDIFTVDTRLAWHSCFGVLLSSDGTVEALWLKFLRGSDNEEHHRGLGASFLFSVIDEIRRGKIPNLRILGLTAERISMSVARILGLNEGWISRVMTEDPSMHQLFMVSKMDATVPNELTQWEQEIHPCLSGDIILTINGRLITRNSDFDVMYNELYLDILVLRDGDEVYLRAPTFPVQETNRAVIFGGAQLQPPHRAVRQVFPQLHSRIYISNIIQSGCPADFFGLQPNTFITAVNEKETETLDDFLRETSKIPGGDYFTVRIVDLGNIESSVTMRRDDHYVSLLSSALQSSRSILYFLNTPTCHKVASCIRLEVRPR
jgi:pro-apoptotic serine protease NMA111